MECVYAALGVCLWDGRCDRARLSCFDDGSEDVTLSLVLGFGVGLDRFSTLLPNPEDRKMKVSKAVWKVQQVVLTAGRR